MKTESPYAGTLPKPGGVVARENFPANLLHSFEFAEIRSEVWPVGIEMMLPTNTGFAELEHILVFNLVHPVRDRMADLRLQFADKTIEDTHLNDWHKAQAFQIPALAGDRIECLIQNVKAPIGAGFAFKMMYSQFAPPCAGWLGMRQC